MFKSKINLKIIFSFLFPFLLLSFFPRINSIGDENLRIRNLLDLVPRFKGKGYARKIDIKYESNQFKCYVGTQITPKEYLFVSNSGNSICSDKIFENFEKLAEKINKEISTNFDPKLLSNVKFLNEFKQVLYFAYYLTYIHYTSNRKNKAEEPKDKFFDSLNISYMQKDLIENLPQQNFNILEIQSEDMKILNNYLHTILDFDIYNTQEKIFKILENIEKALGKKEEWIPRNREMIKYFIGVVWKQAIHIDFE